LREGEMKTFAEQKEFFEAHWPAMREAVEKGGGGAVVDYVKGIEDDLERRVLFVFARMGLVMGDWEGKNFDDYITVCDAGINELLAQARSTGDEEIRQQRINGAHIISYNLAADLADCWPGDEEPRTKEHFERGLKAAEDCLGWCAPTVISGLSMDWWVRGMHQLSLGQRTGALASWEKSLEYAQQAVKAEGGTEEISTESAFGIILGSGYVGLVKAILGKEGGFEQLEQAIGLFTTQMSDEDLRNDAAFGIAQLQCVQGKYLKSTPPGLDMGEEAAKA
jgi:hypothetical protein